MPHFTVSWNPDLCTSIINTHLLQVRRHYLYVTSFQDLKANFWNRGTVDSIRHLDQIFFLFSFFLRYTFNNERINETK